MSRDELFPRERHLALALLFTLPGSDALRDNVLELGETTFGLIEAENDDAIETAYDRQLTAIRSLEEAVCGMVAAD